jgi:tetratricopeptide (TPR) repeat protein
MNRCTPLALSLLLASGAALAQGKADFEFQPDTVEKSGPPSKTLQKALKLYESTDYYSASIELHKVIEGETGDSEANRQRAEFWMGKTLYHLHFYSASLSYFDRIVQKPSEHRYYNATLKWLSSLSRELPESAGILKKIGKYDRAQLEQPALEKIRDELYYLLGRFHYSQSNFKEAISLFSSVPSTSPFYARAKFMEGISYVRSYQGKPASEAFKTLLRTAKDAPATAEIKQFEELSVISLARVFYSTGQYDLSIKYYEQLWQDSPSWLPSLFEASWSYFMKNNYSKALGNIHTINAPFFDNEFFPESYILRAVIYFTNCLYDQSIEAIKEFNFKFTPIKAELDRILAQFKDMSEFYEFAQRIRQDRAGLSPQIARIAKHELSDKTVAKSFQYVDELERELRQVQGADPAWKATAIAGVVLQDLTLQKSLAQNESGQLAHRRIKRLSAEIQELQKQSIKVEYETINGQKNQLEAGLRKEQLSVKTNVDQTKIDPDDEHLVWQFNGEYWRDELGYYRFRIKSACTGQ